MNWTVLATGTWISHRDGRPGLVIVPLQCDTDTITVLTLLDGVENWSIYDVCVKPNE
jgi:hypothetical protein